MKATGSVRRIDDLGRIVIPKNIREDLNIQTGDPFVVYVNDDNEIIFKKLPVKRRNNSDFEHEYEKRLPVNVQHEKEGYSHE